MKKLNKSWQIVAATVLIMSAFACNTNKNKSSIEFIPVTVTDSSSNYSDDTTMFNIIQINYLEAKSNTDDSIANIINQDFFAYLQQFFFAENADMTMTKDNIQDIIASEIKTFIKDISEEESLADCESCRIAELSIGSSVYQTDKIISLVYRYYQYSGGAHGDSGCMAFNYNREDGAPITIDNLTADIDELTEIAEKAFVEQNGTLADYWFEDDRFYLPEVFYFEKNKIVFCYNIYEIAPYTAGSIILELNNDDVKHLIDYIN
ncbi:MAG: DUF3298 and DUF4163 domain-containing protein [Prevotellaceae bacterium]|jgi:hypothetical protein|nr:DUF3298 and DUF4163 domain-containing protein [Prevotellaceae bacterium]